jgi:signal peptidase I
MRSRRLSSWIIAGLLAVLAWVFLAPPALGGQTSYVVTNGVSMAPAFHTGDLALVRRRSGYDVGDVIAYRSPTLGVVILHRIIATEPQGFLIRGDNNTWNDPDLVPADQVIGRLWLHVPRIGSALRVGSVVPVALLAAALCAAPARARPRHHRRRPRRKVPVVHRTQRRNQASALLTGASVAVVIGVALLLISVRAPAAPADSGTGTITHQLDLTYQAPADGAVYQGGELVTGDPVFIDLNPQIDVRVRDHVSGGIPAVPRTVSLQARLTGTSGWQYGLPLGGETVRRGTDSELQVSVDLRDVQNLITRAQARTGFDEGSHQLELVPSLHAASPTGTMTLPPVVFRLQRGQLVLDGGDHPRGAPVTRIAAEPGSGTESGDSRLQIAGLSVPAWQLRTAGVAVLLPGVLLAGIGFAGRRRDPLSRLGQPPIKVTGHDLPAGAVETASLDGLFGLAQRYDRPVLHLPTASRSVYLVEESGTWYWHAGPGRAAATPRDLTGRV